MKTTPLLPQQVATREFMKLKPYQRINEDGEAVNAIKYVEGQPLNIRFNGQSGRFSRDGGEDLGQCLTITPLAFRFFTGSLFGRANAKYAEVFYVDKARNLAVVLFTNASAENLLKFSAQLHYNTADASLTNSVISIRSAVRVRKSGGERYHVAEFEFCEKADLKAVLAFRAFGMDYKIYRADTRNAPGSTTNVEDGLHSSLYRMIWGLGVQEAAPADDREKSQIQDSYK